MARYSIIIVLLIVAIRTVTSEIAAQSSESSAVVVVYHRFGEQQYPSTNIRIDQFERHVALLSNNNPKFFTTFLSDQLISVEANET